VFERERHERPVEVPLPLVAAFGLRDKVIGVARPHTPGAIDVGLAFLIELFEGDSRTSPLDYELSERCDTQRVLCCVVVHLTEQDDTVTLHRLHQRRGIRVDLDRRRSGYNTSCEPDKADSDLDSAHHPRSVSRSWYLILRTKFDASWPFAW